MVCQVPKGEGPGHPSLWVRRPEQIEVVDCFLTLLSNPPLNPELVMPSKQVSGGVISMNNLDAMLKCNREYAAQLSKPGALMPQSLPNVKAVIVGCADMRVDPAHVLGIKPGEAVVMRNIGGRITPGLLEQLGMLGRIGEVVGAIPGGGGQFHLVILHHAIPTLPGEWIISGLVYDVSTGLVDVVVPAAPIRAAKAA